MLFPAIIFGLFGLVFGSFAGATIWRLRAYQLKADKAAGDSEIDKKEYKRLLPLTKARLRDDRSRCLQCGHELAWYDLLPIVSWVSTAGKCRYCRKSIGWFEPIIELAMATLFAATYLYWNQFGGDLQPLYLVVWLIVAFGLVVLFFYDLKWFILPDVIMLPLVVVSALLAVAKVAGSDDVAHALLSAVYSVLILGGLYLALYYYSYRKNGEEKTWVGFGDVKLGLVLGLLLADWQLAFLALFLANVIGTLIVLPGLVTKKLSRTAHVPFGPMLIAGFYIAFFFGQQIISGYLAISTQLTMLML